MKRARREVEILSVSDVPTLDATVAKLKVYGSGKQRIDAWICVNTKDWPIYRKAIILLDIASRGDMVLGREL
jgi:hypothetical protein